MSIHSKGTKFCWYRGFWGLPWNLIWFPQIEKKKKIIREILILLFAQARKGFLLYLLLKKALIIILKLGSVNFQN